MNNRSFIGLATATTLFAAAAIGTTVFSDRPAQVAASHEQVFPDLASNPDAVAKIVIETGAERFSLVRGDEGWLAPEKHNYRASLSGVRKLIVGLADMRFAAAKTARPELFERLEVNDPSDEATSRLVRVEDSVGKILAEAIIGKRKYSLTGDQRQGTYLRMPGETQSWLVTGGLEVEEQLSHWLDRQIIDLANDKIQQIEINPAEGQSYTLARETADASFALDTVPGDRAVKDGETFGRLSSALSSLKFDDVRPLDASAAGVADATARFVTFDGLEVTAYLSSDGEMTWVRFEAQADGGDSSSQADVNALIERFDAWQFAIPSYAADRFNIPLEEWLASSDGTG
jgi:hypothetical protein